MLTYPFWRLWWPPNDQLSLSVAPRAVSHLLLSRHFHWAQRCSNFYLRKYNQDSDCSLWIITAGKCAILFHTRSSCCKSSSWRQKTMIVRGTIFTCGETKVVSGSAGDRQIRHGTRGSMQCLQMGPSSTLLLYQKSWGPMGISWKMFLIHSPWTV